MSKPKLYFACSITGNEQFRTEKLDDVIKQLQAYFEVILPPISTSPACYKEDLALINKSDAVIFYIAKPSTGMGIEMVYCIGHRWCRYAWCFPGEEEALSPFVVGFCEAHGIPILTTVDMLLQVLKEDFCD